MLRIERIPLNAHEMFHTAVCPDQLKVTLRGRSQEYLMGTINRSAPRWRQAERQYSAGRSITFWSLCEASKGCLVRRSRAWFLKLSLAGPAPTTTLIEPTFRRTTHSIHRVRARRYAAHNDHRMYPAYNFANP